MGDSLLACMREVYYFVAWCFLSKHCLGLSLFFLFFRVVWCGKKKVWVVGFAFIAGAVVL